jgi:hypothetical protein
VEPTSVTPFAQPARQRALHAVLVALVRYKAGIMAQDEARKFRPELQNVDRVIELITERVEKVDPREAKAAVEQLQRLVDEWEKRAVEHMQLDYNSSHRAKEVLLRNMGDRTHADGWDTLQSMRNVDRNSLVKIMGQ